MARAKYAAVNNARSGTIALRPVGKTLDRFLATLMGTSIYPGNGKSHRRLPRCGVVERREEFRWGVLLSVARDAVVAGRTPAAAAFARRYNAK